MGFFSGLTKAVIGTATLPIAVVADTIDVATGSLDRVDSTGKAVDIIADGVSEILDFEET